MALKSVVNNAEDYIASLPSDRKEAVAGIRKAILKKLPKGFSEVIANGSIAYVVPHSVYPKGYPANPKMPLPFMAISAQKNHISLHHLGLYGSAQLLQWFQAEYPGFSKSKLDMGKGCVRFKKMDDIPYALIEQLVTKITVKEWISMIEKITTR